MEFDLSKIHPQDLKRVTQRIEEVKVLYGVTEAEFILVQQTLALLGIGLGVSPELQSKLLKVCSALYDAIIEELPKT